MPTTPRTFSPEERAKAAAKVAEKRAAWALLALRQDFEDEAFMRAHLSAAGLVAPHRDEPATVPRLLLLLRRVGFSGPDLVTAIGPTWTDPTTGRTVGVSECLRRFLALNPRLPLWAAVALVLELSGHFTAEALRKVSGALAS